MPKSTPRNDIYDVMNDGVMENIKYGEPEEENHWKHEGVLIFNVGNNDSRSNSNNNSYGKL